MMVTITVELLTGRFVATSPQDRRASEWPPHPARLFSALVAAWSELEDDHEDGRAALEWLESLPPPRIVASDAAPRNVLTHYVPVNDTSVVGLAATTRGYAKLTKAQAQLANAATPAKESKARDAIAAARVVTSSVETAGRTNPDDAIQMLPSGRVRKARYYPSVTPERAKVQYEWPGAEPKAVTRKALDSVLAAVSRLGHSSSLVSCWLDEEAGSADFIPDQAGSLILRTTTAGQLSELERLYEQHRGSGPRTMPSDASRYVRADQVSSRSAPPRAVANTAGEWFVFRQVHGRRLPVTAALKLSMAVRGALMRFSDPTPELVSGHRSDGAPSSDPHVSVVALPYVGTRHADGHVVGFAIQLPRDSVLLGQRDAVVGAIGRWEGDDADEGFRVRVLLAGGIETYFQRELEPIDTRALRRARWSEPKTTWLSVTPIALGRHPGNLASDEPATAARAAEEAEATVAAACAHIGLPEPVEVAVTRAPLLRGSRPARAFPPFRHGRSSPQRLLVHARIRFADPVEGPLVLGAGRYLGMGLMTPVDA